MTRVLTHVFVGFAGVTAPGAALAALTLEPGHVYATTGNTVWQFDAVGSLVGALDMPAGEVRGVAIGPDSLFYVVQDRVGTRVVTVLDAEGIEVRTIPVPDLVFANGGYGKLCFDYRRRVGYVIDGIGLYRFGVDDAAATRLAPGGFDCTVLPDGSILTGTLSGFSLLAPDGSLISAFSDLVDVDGNPSGQFMREVRGVHYAEEAGVTYATLSSGDRLVRLQGASNVVLENVYCDDGADISTTREGEVLVGSRTSAPAIFTHDLMLTGHVDGDPAEFVATYPASVVIFAGRFE